MPTLPDGEYYEPYLGGTDDYLWPLNEKFDTPEEAAEWAEDFVKRSSKKPTDHTIVVYRYLVEPVLTRKIEE